jgi:hypothetical protein
MINAHFLGFLATNFAWPISNSNHFFIGTESISMSRIVIAKRGAITLFPVPLYDFVAFVAIVVFP